MMGWPARALLLVLCVLHGPALAANPDAVAVIIGNRNYRHDVPAVTYAHRDAAAMKRYVLEDLGFRPGNVIELIDATEAEMRSVFGSERNHRGRAFQYVRPGRSDLFVFYSGHGVPGLNDKRGYLLPVDGNPDTADINGYPIDVLYENLRQTGARSVTVLLDACFSGDSPQGMLIKSASPVFVSAVLPTEVDDLTVITAASAGQLASWDDEAELGLFTEHVLLALRGLADQGRYGNDDGDVTLAEVADYLGDEMTYQARRKYNRDQVPTVLGQAERVLAHYNPGSVPAAAARPAAPTPPAQAASAVVALAPTPAPAVTAPPPEPALQPAAGQFVTVTSSNVRDGPGTGNARVVTLAAGTVVEALARTPDGKWLQVARDGAPVGFVFADLLQDRAAYEAARAHAAAAAPPPAPQVALAPPPQPATISTARYNGTWTGLAQSCGWTVFVGADDAAPRALEVELNVQDGKFSGKFTELAFSGAAFHASLAVSGGVGPDGLVDVARKEMEARLVVNLADADRVTGTIAGCEIELTRKR